MNAERRPPRAAPSLTVRVCLRHQLYAKKPANWLEWDQAQVARVKCIAEWNAKKSSLDHTGKLALLKELLVLLFHTVSCPASRVKHAHEYSRVVCPRR